MKEIKKIANSKLSRNLKMMKLALGSGSKFLFSGDKDIKGKLQEILKSEAHKLVNEMGLMKGSIMKVGQMISLYSDAILPKELSGALAQLENKSFYLAWGEIKKNIPIDLFKNIEVEEKPLAAASLGQVHKGKIIETGQEIVLKIQYKGVRKAIDNDIKVLKWILTLTEVLPKDFDLGFVFEEVKEMLERETDYPLEVDTMLRFEELLKNETAYIIPHVYKEFSGEKTIVLDYLDGVSVREVESLALSQEQRNELGVSLLQLFFKEIIDWKLMQTDPNPANFFLVKAGDDYKWGLLDFGASKEISERIQTIYIALIKSFAARDFEKFVEVLIEYDYISSLDSVDRKLFEEYFQVLTEPFQGGVYDWGESTIPDRVLKLAPKVINQISVSKPPKDIIFIDRKIGGVFFILKLIKAKFDPQLIIQQFL
jgi:predicted unusual protein kinase regulating ubiquinone biosynthesis (AarF/ABC1/UbiB family)